MKYSQTCLKDHLVRGHLTIKLGLKNIYEEKHFTSCSRPLAFRDLKWHIVSVFFLNRFDCITRMILMTICIAKKMPFVYGAAYV